MILLTGACGMPGNDCDVFRYDINDESWKNIVTCGEDCEFVDGKIKAHIYWGAKQGECTVDNKYGDSIRWVQME
jgi:hypothetical protein